ncbi:eukaryotic translation initiation factor 4B isoform X1 [Drosophila guanche]|uniref:Blast:Eukaryotic translation initiation factor 4B n=1 Tax=Drosophila guanche TaxID=7266 RepID=A0A3B0KC35_DROGU|nr:eukaryotic translation initiation factor 4B isoform X1 [Drosophila guanche]SPP83266.1 blast:Eukaryotic translation initiation factor 4B [Drosophila guanche]
MASAGKKGKKNKGTVISLQSFLSNGDTPAGTTQVSKKIRNLDGDDSDDGSSTLPSVYQLPTAPRANRIFDDNSIPHRPPFIAYINNLPFDANEDDLYEFFGSINLISLRLPREDGENGRSRGFGYVELESRDDLIHVLSLPDPSIKGRRIRIELSNENDQQNRQKSNRRFEGFGNSSDNRDSVNWRRDSQNNGSSSGGYAANFDRSFNRERKPISEREDSNTPGSWRTSVRPQSNDYSPPRRDYDQSNDKYRDGRGKNIERYVPDDDSKQEERPKLNLKPRTLPLPDIKTNPDLEDAAEVNERNVSKQGATPSVNVFGSAKPVDTASRELEIEERLAYARRQDKIRQEEEHLTEKLSEVQIDKNENESINPAVNWRQNQESSDDNKQDDRRRDDVNRSNKARDHDRSENVKGKTGSNDEGKYKEDNKNTRNDRELPKYHPDQTGPVLQSSNKYSGLDDEGSD